MTFYFQFFLCCLCFLLSFPGAGKPGALRQNAPVRRSPFVEESLQEKSIYSPWLKAKNLNALRRIIKKQEREKELKMLCLRQLTKKHIPHYCYEWLKSKKPTNKKELIQYFDENCLKAGLYPKNPENIKNILSRSGLSPLCRKKIKQEKEKNEYRLRDGPPGGLLNRHQ